MCLGHEKWKVADDGSRCGIMTAVNGIMGMMLSSIVPVPCQPGMSAGVDAT